MVEWIIICHCLTWDGDIMCYSVMDYAQTGVLFPLFALTVVFILVIFIAKTFAKRKFPTFVIIFPILIFGLLFFTGMKFFADGFRFPIIALFQSNAPVQTTLGQVTNIQDAPAIPVYYDRETRDFLPAMLITVNNDDYYVLHSNIETGQWVSLTWITDERVVLSWADAEQAVAEQSPVEESMGQDLPQNNSIAPAVMYVSGVLFLILLGSQYLFGRKISEYLQKQDRQCSNGVIPNRFGILYFLIVYLPVFGFLIGWGANGFHGAFLIAILVLGFFLRIMMLKQTTFLSLDGDELVFREFKTTRAFPVEEIINVSWGTSKIPHNRSLIIQFPSGYSIVLEQENYWGLEDMYHKLSQKEHHQK